MKEQFKTSIQPKIPKGFKHIEGAPENGFVIQSTSGNQFVWVPVEALTPNGTDNNGKTYEALFGRRTFGQKSIDLTKNEFWEDEVPSLKLQRMFVEKYGGFYVSRFSISATNKSVPETMPIVDINMWDAETRAKSVECSDEISSRLMYGSEYDSLLEWILESGAKTLEELTDMSQESWGNLWTRRSTRIGLCKSDENPAWSTNRIYDINGNASTWTLECYAERNRTIRGVGWDGAFGAVHRGYSSAGMKYRGCGYRVALQWLK